MEELKNLLGTKIKSIRKSYSLTQEEFSERIGIEIPTLSNIENCKCTPSLQTIIKILELFNIAPNDFFGFVNWHEESENPLNLEINERVKLLPDNLKTNLLEVIKSLKP